MEKKKTPIEEFKEKIQKLPQPKMPDPVKIILIVEHRISKKREDREYTIPYLNHDLLMQIVDDFRKSVKVDNWKLKSIYRGDGELLWEPIFEDPETE